ncbi:Rab GTPase [Dictyostelium purpureum]|uniref:Rab GTPase n=1 Tax=Dictyostelium purpureum TaxID=5786 RepID=F0ZJJ9_DICPU|nr:Rab GTPase [Dictyostelium purpureum]EGC35874.1 Rab GTPase [Dictyostelium purpureum]|eukprot:XP_003287605.1 Rab GTPase [Dictyostelium purpureum]
MTKNKIDLKVVLLGYASVGKTCIVYREMYNQFGDTHTTIGGAFSSKRAVVGDTEVLLGIWDTAGTERYQAVNRSYYRRANAAIVCYDLTNSETWEKVTFWAEELTQNEPDIEIYIVGTKLDLIQHGEQRAIPNIRVEETAKRYNAHIFETSSRTGENVSLLFQTIAENFCKKTNNGTNLPNHNNNNSIGNSVKVDQKSEKEKGGCC